MRVLGVDPGLGRCGWAVLERHGGRVAAAGYGTIETDGDQVAPRLAELATKLRQVLAVHRPEALAIERLFFNANVRTAMTVGQASGRWAASTCRSLVASSARRSATSSPSVWTVP